MQCCQCVVACQCFSNLLCSFYSSCIILIIFISAKVLDGLLPIIFQNANLTLKCNVVNVLLIFNASAIFSTPSYPILSSVKFCRCHDSNGLLSPNLTRSRKLERPP